ncbi:MAG: hypothetical protein Q9195_007773, partial [Heterodermia aff. obscurata]
MDEKDVEEFSAPSAQSSPPNEAGVPISIDHEISYPEGGLQGWLVVLGAFCGTAASIGLYNTSGLFEAYMATQLLPNDAGIFFDGTGAMALTTAGAVLTDLAYYIPMTYIPAYYIARQQIASDATSTGAASFAYQLLAIANGSSCVGRLLAGYISDRLGRYNTMIISLFLCAVSVFCFWLPDILIPDVSNIGLLIVFVMLFGCVSGSNVSLLPVCMGQLCETRDFGRYYATCFSVVAFGALISIPVAGALIDAVEGPGKLKFWGVAVFTGLCYAAATLCFVW